MRILFCLCTVLCCFQITCFSHPTGNMIVVNDNILWSYVDPVDDPDHHACVMISKNGGVPEVLIKSEFPASDYMLFSKSDNIYLLERRFLQDRDQFQFRILKMRIEGSPIVIWDWREDQYRVGEGGYFMPNDTSIVFGRYPGIYYQSISSTPESYFQPPSSIKRIRLLSENRILLLADSNCWITDQSGQVLKSWNDLTKPVTNPPLNRNMIFDADYQDGMLLLAYWGSRTFMGISSNSKKEILLEVKKPFVPHWVAIWAEKQLLFASSITFDGSNPKPLLIENSANGKQKIIWEDSY